MAEKFVASYSGGKDSALAICRAIARGMEPVALITTYNTGMGRSWFHGIPQPLLADLGRQMGMPHKLIETDGEDYNQRFEQALIQCRDLGADSCVFGDIDIEDHRKWGEERCEAAGLLPVFPLWNESREALVREFVERGFTAHITVVDTRRLSPDFLGRQLTLPTVEALLATEADVCGENGEYHSFVSDGPIFRAPVAFSFGEKTEINGYALLPVNPPTAAETAGV